jgi:hypothetical protein
MVNPSLSPTRIVWVSQYSRVTALWVKTLGTSTRRRIYRTTKKTRLLWTTGLHARSAYVTQWSSSTRASTLVRVNF